MFQNYQDELFMGKIIFTIIFCLGNNIISKEKAIN